ncbi:hypothetical protein MUG78_10105 [Gordonia alkaliphila]|uniref:hypothetical protein n=1 Tax=Gordonia alkaliphila TaxID=1053547 RepID=UPI001FF57D5E|nr:hypothetical protein [Gordonia alkaliphila]MCK0439798.1 hypothetical protein [Gordonia alkaliphila]
MASDSSIAFLLVVIPLVANNHLGDVDVVGHGDVALGDLDRVCVDDAMLRRRAWEVLGLGES